MEKMFNFPTKETWEEFVNSLNLNDPNIALLVEECNLWRKRAGEYYEKWVLTQI